MFNNASAQQQQRRMCSMSQPTRQQQQRNSRVSAQQQQAPAPTSSHDLNIKNYSLPEIFSLFHLPQNQPLTKDAITQAKRITLSLHPDKNVNSNNSNLSASYFIFYKQAYDILCHIYTNSHNNADNNTDTRGGGGQGGRGDGGVYIPNQYNTLKKEDYREINKIKKEEFNQTFNDIFDKYDMASVSRPKNTASNAWWSSAEPTTATATTNATATSASNIGNAIQQIRQEKKRELQINPYREVATLYGGVGGGGGTSGGNYFDDDDDEDDDNGHNGGHYIECNPFSKLKFDDLKKVHKDQTIFEVSEYDYNEQPALNMNEYKKQRDVNMTPMEKQQAEMWFIQQEQQKQTEMLQKKYKMEMKIKENEEKSKMAVASFLRLT